MRLRAQSLLGLVLWSMPIAAFACNDAGAHSYTGVTQIYVSTDGLTAPVAIHADSILAAGNCPQPREARISQQGAAMSGYQCVYLPSGKLSGKICCPTSFATDDPPARIFARLLAVLERDRFYDVAAEPSANFAPNGAVFKIAVVRCAPLPTVLQITIPFGTKPGTVLAPDVVRLLDDVTNALYQSTWYGQDVY